MRAVDRIAEKVQVDRPWDDSFSLIFGPAMADDGPKGAVAEKHTVTIWTRLRRMAVEHRMKESTPAAGTIDAGRFIAPDDALVPDGWRQQNVCRAAVVAFRDFAEWRNDERSAAIRAVHDGSSEGQGRITCSNLAQERPSGVAARKSLQERKMPAPPSSGIGGRPLRHDGWKPSRRERDVQPDHAKIW
jgi:hypothetical protein